MRTRSIAAALSLLTVHVSAQPPEPHNDPETGAFRKGALSGASIFVSPGHGWMYESGRGWVTQRTNTHGIVEDHSNAETVIQYLLPYLENAGARVYVARERDMQTNMVIVEPGGSGYSETGDWDIVESTDTWKDAPLRTTRAVTGAETARAVFTPDIPEEGAYAVYAWYAPHPRRRTVTDARFVINHTGGTTVFQQDLNRDFATWKYLGTYWFDEGANDVRGSVVIPNQSDKGGDMITVGAIRFGGGMGDLSVPPSGLFDSRPADLPPLSGKPRWEESGHTYSVFTGLDPSTTTQRFNVVWAMPLWAQWESELWEKDVSVYLSWHTNGSIDHKVRGLSTYIYGVYGWGPHEDFSGIPGGVELANAVHDRLIHVMRNDWDPEWEDVGKVTRWLGETNPRGNSTMPALLVENGFHDNVDDAADILQPRFRDTGAKGVMQGLIDYYAQHVDGFDNNTYPPEKPINLRITTNLRGEVTIAWDEPPAGGDASSTLGHAATGYRVYRSLNGRGFDNGFDVSETSWRPRTLISGEVAHYRVTATNAGGESLPTETLAVRLSHRDRPEILVVNGFDRLDSGLNIVLPDGEQRGILSRMNPFNTIIQHADALAQCGEDFDTASNEAVINGSVALSNYRLVIWMLGRESTADRTFDDREQQLVSAYLERGGKLIASGAHIGTDLSSTTGGAQFLADVFAVRHAATASTHTATPVGPFSELAPISFSHGTGKNTLVDSPDVFEPLEGATVLLAYEDGSPAAVATPRSILMAIPFESIDGSEVRGDMMKLAIRAMLGASDEVALTPDFVPQSAYSNTGG